MDNPGWILVPWGVFALAALLKVWRITSAIRNRFNSSERFRQSLERIWIRDSLQRP